MEITQSTVPGAGKLHDVATRGGQHFRIFVKDSGGSETFVYTPGAEDDWLTIELDADEADQIANILHSRPVLDRLAVLERRMTAVEQELDRR